MVARLLHRLLFLALVAGGLALTGVGGAVVVEQNNEFCAVCHTEPETTYVKRLVQARQEGFAPTLAVAHALATSQRVGGVRCIDCHGGMGLQGRIEGLQLAFRDAHAFLVGEYEQPAKMDYPLPDGTCIACHRDWAENRDFENHFHWFFLEPGAPTDIRCVDCHVAHTEGNDFELFISREVVFPQCEACHRFMGRGPTQMGP